MGGLWSPAMSHRDSEPAMSGAMEPAMSQGANEGAGYQQTVSKRPGSQQEASTGPQRELLSQQ